ncbi:MAG: dephospho-CoA kinase [Eubacterium sp.]|nr:dephospho-CoA kinase [Eubacterium sp.]
MENKNKIAQLYILGITGGIGSGKSEVLRLLSEQPDTCIVESDKLAHRLMEPGHTCYRKIVEAFGSEILAEDARIDRAKLGALVFADPVKLEQLNRIVHPAVKQSIRNRIRRAGARGLRLFVIEAALLIQDGYRSICDELWYIHVEREVRIQRLLAGRGGNREKWESVLASQPEDTFFLENTDVSIENSGSFEELRQAVLSELRRISGS